MGEHVRIGQTIVKIGTCENMYYIGHAEYLALLKAGRLHAVPGNEQPTEYARMAEELTWRFPWPDEKPDGGVTGPSREAFKTVVIGMPKGVAVEHVTVSIAVNIKHAYNVNVRIACPSTPGEKTYTHSPIPDGTIAKVRGERYKDGKPYTVFACGYCDAAFVLNADELQVVREHYAKTYNGNGPLDCGILERFTARVD